MSGFVLCFFWYATTQLFIGCMAINFFSFLLFSPKNYHHETIYYAHFIAFAFVFNSL